MQHGKRAALRPIGQGFAVSTAVSTVLTAALVLLLAGCRPGPTECKPGDRCVRYEVTDLGTLGGDTSEAADINNAGQVVGTSTTPSGERHAFLWEPGGAGMIDVGAPCPGGSRATALNNHRRVTGYWHCGNSTPERAFTWENGQFTALDLPPGGTFSRAHDLNDRGQVVGEGDMSDPQYPNVTRRNALLWSDGKVVPLLDPPPQASAVASGINGNGEVTGTDFLVASSINNTPFLWKDGTTEFLPHGGFEQNIIFGPRDNAYAINDAGLIVGEAFIRGSDGAHVPKAILWEDRQPRTLGEGSAFAINNPGRIVGTSVDGRSARLWRDGEQLDLNELIAADSGWVLQRAHGINDFDQIVGVGTVNGQTRAFLLTPRLSH